MKVIDVEKTRHTLRKVCRSWRIYWDGTPGCTYSVTYTGLSHQAVESIRMEFQQASKPLPTCHRGTATWRSTLCDPCTKFERLASDDVRVGCRLPFVKAIIDPQGFHTDFISKYDNLEMLAVRFRPTSKHTGLSLYDQISSGYPGSRIAHLSLNSYHPREEDSQHLSSAILQTLVIDLLEEPLAGDLYAPLSKWNLPGLEYLSVLYRHGQNNDMPRMRGEIKALIGNTGSTLKGICLCVESAGGRFYIPSDLWETCSSLESIMVYPHVLRELPPALPGRRKTVTIVLKNILASPYADGTGEEFIRELHRSRGRITGIAQKVKMDLSWEVFERAANGGRTTFFAKIFRIFTTANLTMLDRYEVPLNRNVTPLLTRIRCKMQELRQHIETIELSDEHEIIEISD
jgi:hypothetical protein